MCSTNLTGTRWWLLLIVIVFFAVGFLSAPNTIYRLQEHGFVWQTWSIPVKLVVVAVVAYALTKLLTKKSL